MQKNKPLLIFDFDGTIADSLTIGLEISNRLSNKYHYEKIESLDIIREHSAINFIKKHVSWYRLPFWLHHLKKEIMNHLDDIKLYPGIRESLLVLSNDHDLGIIGGGPKQYHKNLLPMLNLDIFGFVESDTAFNKDRLIKRVLKQYPHDRTLYIGDDIKDIEAAKKSGIKVIAVSWGSTHKFILEKYHPDAIAEHPNELIKLTKALL